jgi:hypothetical protein
MLIGNPKYPEVVCVRSVKPLAGLKVHIIFTDGTERDMDLEPYLHGPIFDPIRRNPHLFDLVYVDRETETLTWPNGADIAPETLYYEGNPPWAAQVPLSSRAAKPAPPRPAKRTSVRRRTRVRRQTLA